MKFTYYYIQDYLNKQEIKKINSIFKKKAIEFKKQAPTLKTSIAVQMPYEEIQKIKDINSTVININRLTFGFDLYENINDYVVQNTYSAKYRGQYKWHQDGEPYSQNYTIKLTTLINLSEEKYSGGEFFIHEGGNPHHVKVLDKPGSLLCFPSFILHKVTPVTKGTRITGTVFKSGRWWK